MRTGILSVVPTLESATSKRAQFLTDEIWPKQNESPDNFQAVAAVDDYLPDDLLHVLVEPLSHCSTSWVKPDNTSQSCIEAVQSLDLPGWKYSLVWRPGVALRAELTWQRSPTPL